MTGTYSYFGTCDSCAQGDRPLREVDPVNQAWICAECDERHEHGIEAAAQRVGTTREVAAIGIDAYFVAIDEEAQS